METDKRKYFTDMLTKLGVEWETSVTEEHLLQVDACTTKAEVRALALAFTTKVEVTPLTKEQEESLTSASSVLRPRLAQLERQQTEYIHSAQSYSKEAASRLANAYKVGLEILEAQGKEIKLVDMVNKIISDGFYSFVQVDGKKLVFNTQPIVLAHGEMRVSMGSYTVALNLETGTERITSKKITQGFIHPHVADGLLCRGELSSPMLEAHKQGDIATIMECIRAVLTTYNDESPFKSLWKFDIDLHPEKYQDEEVDVAFYAEYASYAHYVPENAHRSGVSLYDDRAESVQQLSGVNVSEKVQLAIAAGAEYIPTHRLRVKVYNLRYKKFGYAPYAKFIRLRNNKYVPIISSEVDRSLTLPAYRPFMDVEEVMEWIDD